MIQSKALVIRNKVGLHARPAALFVQTAAAHQSEIKVSRAGQSGNAKSILSILALGIQQGAEITIAADGPDEVEAIAALTLLIEGNFGEPA